MSRDHKQEDYLVKARDADEMAEKARDVLTREAWRKIAQNYRVLAGSSDEGGAQTATAPSERTKAGGS